MSLLERILQQKRSELTSPPLLLRDELPVPSPPLGPSTVLEALRRPHGAPLRLIGEIKFKSPSAGALSRKLSAGERAVAYARGGARMVSVLCDAAFFGGSFLDLAEARQALDAAGLAVPLLAKEFIIDPVQLEWAARHGASAVLLIVRIVPPEIVRGLTEQARALGLEPFVEVTTEAERDAAIEAGATIIGVNARDLDTLAIDAGRTTRVIAGIPAERVSVHLSGLGSRAAVTGVAASRADAALVGEALMRVDDPRQVLRDFVSASEGR
jgi:indole-3-glycerol phosphate synthase